MLVLDMQFGNIVDNKGFQEFLKAIDPKYTPPCCRTIMRDHFPSLYQDAMEELQDQLILLDNYRHMDLSSHHGYITVTCHFLTDEGCFRHYSD